MENLQEQKDYILETLELLGEPNQNLDLLSEQQLNDLEEELEIKKLDWFETHFLI